MELRELFGLGIAFLVLAGISVAIVNGGNTANVVGAFADGFAKDINAATLQSR